MLPQPLSHGTCLGGLETRREGWGSEKSDQSVSRWRSVNRPQGTGTAAGPFRQAVLELGIAEDLWVATGGTPSWRSRASGCIFKHESIFTSRIDHLRLFGRLQQRTVRPSGDRHRGLGRSGGRWNHGQKCGQRRCRRGYWSCGWKHNWGSTGSE